MGRLLFYSLILVKLILFYSCSKQEKLKPLDIIDIYSDDINEISKNLPNDWHFVEAVKPYNMITVKWENKDSQSTLECDYMDDNEAQRTFKYHITSKELFEEILSEIKKNAFKLVTTTAFENRFISDYRNNDFIITTIVESSEGKDKYSFLIEKRKLSEGLEMVFKNKKIGFIDKDCNLIIAYRFGMAYDFKNGIAGVWENNNRFYIDKKGNCVKDCPE